MKLEKGKIYKCWEPDGSYCLKFSDGRFLYYYNGYSGYKWKVSEFTKVEPYEPEAVDTLQEVVDWCEENDKEIVISKNKTFHTQKLFKEATDYNQIDLLTHIRQEPKELTELKALAEKLGFELTKKD